MRIQTILMIAMVVTLGMAQSCKTMMIGENRNGYALFVAPNGNDEWTGTRNTPNLTQDDGPFRTIEKARDTIRELIKNDKLTKPVVVYIRGGIYEIDEPVTFTHEDSGTSTCPIRYMAYPDETPIISAGKKLTVNSVERDGNIVSFKVPEVVENGWVFRQLFVNGERKTRARMPNNGMNKIVGKFNTNDQAQAKFMEGDIKPEWAELGDVEFVSPVKWSQARMPIIGVDTDNNIVTLAGAMRSHMLVDGQRFWIENLHEALDAPGEWYLDDETGSLYYYLDANENINELEFYAPVHEHAIVLQGNPEQGEFVDHLEFAGLEMRYTAWPMPETGHASEQAAHYIPAAFHANGANFCKVHRCTIQHIGNYGIHFEQGCRNNRIIGNTINDVGAGGIRLGEKVNRDDESLLTRNNFVTDNTIKNFGEVFPAAVGVWIGQSSHNAIRHNHIHDGYYTGLSVGWTWAYRESNCHHNILEYNHIHDIGKYFLSDMGGIYTLGMQEGTVVRNNVFHDIYAYTYGGWGLYPDEGSTGIVYENNVVYNTKSAGFHQHYGKENVVRNNVLAFGTEYQVMRTRNEDHLSFIFENNIVYWDSGELLGSNFEGDNYQFNNNLYWDTRGQNFKFKDWTWEEWQTRGQDVFSEIADPLFVNADEFDFRLRDESPAHEMGIEEIDVSTVGPRKEMLKINYPR